VERVTKGRVKIVIHTDATLVPPNEEWEAIKSGLVDMGFGMPQMNEGMFPITDVMHLPFLGLNTAGANMLTWWETYQSFPEVQAEYKGVKILSVFGNNPQQLHSIKKPVRNLQDMKGLIVGCNYSATKIYQALGSSPAPMLWSDMYSSADKGVVNAIAFPWEGLSVLKFGEVTKVHTQLDMNSSVYYVAINQKLWDKLPADLQEAVMSVSGEVLGQRMSDVGYQAPDVGGIEYARKHGHEIIWLASENPKELERWKKATNPLKDKWVQDMVDRKLLSAERAREILNSVMANAKKYSAQYVGWDKVNWAEKYNMSQYNNWKK
jgi:TRAP-type C4-dicarboxylate transport system substrate-binding protein